MTSVARSPLWLGAVAVLALGGTAQAGAPEILTAIAAGRDGRLTLAFTPG